jgi:hypothetical protein
LSELVRIELSDGGFLLVEAVDQGDGVARASRRGTVVNAVRTLRESFDQVRAAADDIMQTFGQMDSVPKEVEIEFGVRILAETGAVVAKVGGEAHFTVRLAWAGPDS